MEPKNPFTPQVTPREVQAQIDAMRSPAPVRELRPPTPQEVQAQIDSMRAPKAPTPSPKSQNYVELFKNPFSNYNMALGKEVPTRPGYYVPPGTSPYSPAPSTVQRFARSLAATPNLTEDALARHVLRYTPEQYNEMRLRRASGGHTLPQPPATTKDQRNTEYMGSLIKQASDPIGLTAAWYGRPLQVALGSGAYEAAKEATHQLASGRQRDAPRIANTAVTGLAGGYLGGRLFRNSVPSTATAGVIGRQAASSTTGELVQDAEAKVLGRP